MQHRDCYLVRGLPGAGKTAFMESIRQEGDVTVATDDFLTNENGEYEWTQERLEQAIGQCLGKTEKAMQDGVQKIFVHGVFDKEEHLSPYYKLAKRHGYRVFSIIVENRHGGVDAHAVPLKILEQFRHNFDVQL